MPQPAAIATDCGGAPCRVAAGSCVDAPRYFNGTHVTSAADDCVHDSECGDDPYDYCEYDPAMELFTCEPGAHCE